MHKYLKNIVLKSISIINGLKFYKTVLDACKGIYFIIFIFLGCAVGNTFIPMGKTLTMDDCGNKCSCRNENGKVRNHGNNK